MNKEELTKQMKKELKGQHRASVMLIILGSVVILVFSLIMYFTYEQQTSLDICLFPLALLMGCGSISAGLLIWNGPLFGMSIEEKYEKKIKEADKETEVKEDEM